MGLLNKQKLFEKVQKIEQIWTSERFWEKKTEKPKDFDKICVWDGPVVVQMWRWKKVMRLKKNKNWIFVGIIL